MSIKRKSYTAAEKARIALEAIKGNLTAAEITTRYDVHTTQINQWKRQVLDSLPEVVTVSDTVIYRCIVIINCRTRLYVFITECFFRKMITMGNNINSRSFRLNCKSIVTMMDDNRSFVGFSVFLLALSPVKCS